MTTRSRGHARGFTLIELGVVLVLTAMVLAVAAPGLARLAARVSVNAALTEVEDGIASLPRIAYARGDEGTLAELASRHLGLPADWTLEGADAIYIRSNGVCSGGSLDLVTPYGERRLDLAPPYCTVEAAP